MITRVKSFTSYNKRYALYGGIRPIPVAAVNFNDEHANKRN